MKPLFVILLTIGLTGCDSSRETQKSETPAAAKRATAADRVDYPREMRTGFDPVDEFIARALSTCIEGDYEAFRLLWSVRQNPLPRNEFEQGWHAVKVVHVRAVEKVVLPEDSEAQVEDSAADTSGVAGDVSFALYLQAEFDPATTIGHRRPTRDIVLLVVREQGAWRLGRAPEFVREWIKDLQAKRSEDSGP